MQHKVKSPANWRDLYIRVLKIFIARLNEVAAASDMQHRERNTLVC